MRFIKDLNQETIKLLENICKRSKYYRVRQRAHCILLSHKGYSTRQLVEIFNVDLITIYNWFDAWESRGLAGLYDKKGKGRKPKLTSEIKEQIKEWAKEFPKQLSKIRSLVREKFGISISKETIKRVLRAFNLSWRRVRRKVKGQPDPQEYEKKKEVLEKLKAKEEQGEIELWYFDESGFCLIPYLPYAWQEKGKTIELESSGNSQRLNVLGFLNRNNNLQAYTFECNIDSDVVTACIDDFCKNTEGSEKEKVLVIDNASTHTSHAFEDKITEWEEKGLKIFRLPKYSPELNLIEILWRFIKYEWINFDAYKSWEHLVNYVENVIRNFGTEYRINFV